MPAVSLLFHDVFTTDPTESGFRSSAADRYKLAVPDFEAQLDGLWDVETTLTFDDGGVSYYTTIADRLEEVGRRGYCFVTTDFIGQRGFLTPGHLRELDARGHIIGTHSATHPARFSALTLPQMQREWCDSRCHLEDVLGHAVTVGSVPGGYYSIAVGRAAAVTGLRTLFTSEPTARQWHTDGCELLGRFTIRRGHPPDMARRFALQASARCGAWIGWNTKALVKPVLGASYARIADWILEPNR